MIPMFETRVETHGGLLLTENAQLTENESIKINEGPVRYC